MQRLRSDRKTCFQHILAKQSSIIYKVDHHKKLGCEGENGQRKGQP